jgi:hypothetical protein
MVTAILTITPVGCTPAPNMQSTSTPPYPQIQFPGQPADKGTAPAGQNRQPVILPHPETSGPWDNDVLVFRINPDNTVIRKAAFERAGVPTIIRMIDGKLIAAHQYFSADDPANFDKVAVRFSTDDGDTWTGPGVIHLSGLPDGMRFPFDPTLLLLPDGRIRLYFTSVQGRRFEEGIPAIYSAISANGIDYIFEPGIRFSIPGRPVIDCAAVLHQGSYHLFCPDNGVQNSPPPGPGTGYHAVSSDGLNFTRTDDVIIAGNRRWLGNAQSGRKIITFWGTAQNGMLWLANSTDGKAWTLLDIPAVYGMDPGAVASLKGGWIIVATGPPRPGTPSAQQQIR